MKIIPLGIGSALPSRESHFSATVVEVGADAVMLDCGEGTQNRALEVSLKWGKFKVLCITHLHGDHYFGLPGLLSTLSLVGWERPVKLIGPAGLEAFVKSIPSRTPEHNYSYEIEYIELNHTAGLREVYASQDCRILAHPIEHSVPAYGYRVEETDTPGNLDVEKARSLGITDFMDFRRLKQGIPVQKPGGGRVSPEEVVSAPSPGASFAYITDTRPCEGGLVLARHAELVYHEATFLHEDHERAVNTYHTTAIEAARIARDAGVGKLLIGHFSGRYKNTAVLVDEARTVFKNTQAAEELKRYLVLAGKPVSEEMAAKQPRSTVG